MLCGHKGNDKMVSLKLKCVYEVPRPCQNANPDSVGVVSEKLQGTLVLLLNTQTTFICLSVCLSIYLSICLTVNLPCIYDVMISAEVEIHHYK